MVFRLVVGFGLLLAACAVHGNELHVDYEGQLPENVVIEGLPITYSFKNTNVDDGIGQAADGIGTGMRIKVNGVVIPANSGVFTSDGCIVDPSYPDFWACHDLIAEGFSQEYSFTWTPPQSGSYLMDFYGLCQEMPIPNPPRYCEVNNDVPTVAYFYTDVSPDTDGDGISDGNDPDDDNDGIADDMDTKPLVPSNLCTGGDFDNATLGIAVVDELTCAARASIKVYWPTQVMGPPAHLRLIAPSIGFWNSFNVHQDGRLTVISADPCPGCGGYEVGDTGPAGGIVFYVTDGGWHGLEAAQVDQSEGAPWGCYGTAISGADGTDIGSGAQNTAAILEQCLEAGIAARLAASYSLNGFDDWFLPSGTELLVMIDSLGPNGTGDLVGDFYWSSKQRAGDTEDALARTFTGFSYQTKTIDNRVRAARAF